MTESVLFVAPSAYPLGGVATWLDYLLPGLAERGWRAVLGLTAGRFHDVDHYRARHPWSDVVPIESPTGTPEGRVRALVRTMRQLRPDLVAGVNIPDAYAAVARMRAGGEPAPRVLMTNHSVEEQYLRDAESWAATLDGLVCTNRLACRQALQHRRLDAGRIHYAGYGVAFPADVPSRRPGSSILRIAYSGRLDGPQKRVNDIPAILASLDRDGVAYELLIAGAGPQEEELKARLRPQLETGRVQFLGVLDAAALVPEVYRRADVLLVTSLWETGPIVTWEAMAQGLAVVTSRYVGSASEGSLKDGVNCLMYEIGDAQAAAAQLQRVRDLGESLAAAGRQLVEERYTHAVSVATWDACLRRILLSPGLPEPAASRPMAAAAGRLDALVGTGGAETVRQVLRRRYRHVEPGGEWPHSHSESATDQATYWDAARRLDHG